MAGGARTRRRGVSEGVLDRTAAGVTEAVYVESHAAALSTTNMRHFKAEPQWATSQLGTRRPLSLGQPFSVTVRL